MASAGPNSGSTFANRFVIGATAWSNPSNAAASDDSRANATLGLTTSTQGLKCTNFGFAIDSGATIDGIVVEIERSVNTTSRSPRDSSVLLVKGGTASGANKASGTTWPTTEAYATYGSASDLWSLTWAPADINATDFGVDIAGQISAGKGSVDLRIDHVRITVYYTVAAAGIPFMMQRDLLVGGFSELTGGFQ